MADSQDRSPVDLICDLLIYAPVGFAFEAPKLLPELATKGRDQVATARSVGQLVVRQAGTRLSPLVDAMVGGFLSGLCHHASPQEGVADAAGPQGRVGETADAEVPDVPEEQAALDEEPERDEEGVLEEPPDPDDREEREEREELGESLSDASPTGQAALSGDPEPPDVVDALASSAATALAEAVDVPEVEDLAIPHYDSLAASQVVPRLSALSDEELSALRGYESAHRGRRTILNRIEQLLGRADGRAG